MFWKSRRRGKLDRMGELTRKTVTLADELRSGNLSKIEAAEHAKQIRTLGSENRKLQLEYDLMELERGSVLKTLFFTLVVAGLVHYTVRLSWETSVLIALGFCFVSENVWRNNTKLHSALAILMSLEARMRAEEHGISLKEAEAELEPLRRV